jgi:hypothetical protein
VISPPHHIAKGGIPQIRCKKNDLYLIDTAAMIVASPFNRRVTSDARILQLYHLRYGWIPGDEQIRPSQTETQSKKEHCDWIRETYQSNKDYVQVELFGLPGGRSSTGKLEACATSLALNPIRKKLVPNRFPYRVPEGTHHYIMWYLDSKDKLSDRVITRDIAEELESMGHNHFEFVWYENPKMTIPDVYHIQVFFREGGA